MPTGRTSFPHKRVTASGTGEEAGRLCRAPGLQGGHSVRGPRPFGNHRVRTGLAGALCLLRAVALAADPSGSRSQFVPAGCWRERRVGRPIGPRAPPIGLQGLQRRRARHVSPQAGCRRRLGRAAACLEWQLMRLRPSSRPMRPRSPVPLIQSGRGRLRLHLERPLAFIPNDLEAREPCPVVWGCSFVMPLIPKAANGAGCWGQP